MSSLQFVQPLPQSMRCASCGLPWEPEAATQCEGCEAAICVSCGQKKPTSCASCHKEGVAFGPLPRLVRELAGNLSVFCPHKETGCGWTGPRASLQIHVATCSSKPAPFRFVYAEGIAIPEELNCPMCLNPFQDPVQLPCEHVFCKSCVHSALQHVGECPLDRLPATADKVKAAPKMIQKMVEELAVTCPNKSKGCTWIGARNTAGAHVAGCQSGKPADLQCMKLSVETEFPSFKAGDTKESIYAMAHLSAPTLQDLDQRKKPLAISAVIDVSGSMSGAKLNMAKDSLRFMIEELSDRDYLGIIAFHTTVSEPITLTKMDDHGKRLALSAVEGLHAQSCTNLSGGLFAGMDQVQGIPFSSQPSDNLKKSKSQPSLVQSMKSRLIGGLPFLAPAAPAKVADSCRAVLLFTDGIANEGIQNEASLKSTLQTRLRTSNDMVIHTFGFGGDHNANMLQGLAEVAGGTYYYIQDVSSMKESFADCLGGLLSTVAQGISLTAVAQPGFEIEKILTSFKVEVKNNAHVVSIKDLYSAEQRDILVRLKLSAAVPVGTARPLVAFSVEYDSLISGKSESTATVCCIDAADKKYEGKPNPKVSEQRTRVEATEAMEEAKRKADSGDVVGARAQLKAAKECMQARAEANESCTTYVKAVFNDMDQIECQMGNERQWATEGSKVMATAQLCHQQQRMNCVSEAKSAAYGFDNAFKKEMRCKSRKS